MSPRRLRDLLVGQANSGGGSADDKRLIRHATRSRTSSDALQQPRHSPRALRSRTPSRGRPAEQFRTFPKQDGRLAAIVWGPPPTVGFSRAVPVILDELELPPLPTDRPGIFALANADDLARRLADAGFHDVEAGTLTVVYEAPSP